MAKKKGIIMPTKVALEKLKASLYVELNKDYSIRDLEQIIVFWENL